MSGVGRHKGDDLTAKEIAALPKGAEVVVTWPYRNGPWWYEIVIDGDGTRRVANDERTELSHAERVTLR
jgi:hypothetical protein